MILNVYLFLMGESEEWNFFYAQKQAAIVCSTEKG